MRGVRLNDAEVRTKWRALENLDVQMTLVESCPTCADASRRAQEWLEAVRYVIEQAESLTTADVRAYITARKEEGAAAATINRDLALLRRAYSLAMKADIISTAPHIGKLKENNVRKGFFEQEQLEAVLVRLPGVLQDVVRFAAITGWRVPSEVLTLQWRQVDLDGVLSPHQQTPGVIRLEVGDPKNGEGRLFPCTPELRDLLLARKQAAGTHQREHGEIVPWVFHHNGERISQYGFLRTAWKRACQRAGCPGRLLHDFRRTAVRSLSRAGVSDVVSMRLTGHKTRSVFDRYTSSAAMTCPLAWRSSPLLPSQLCRAKVSAMVSATPAEASDGWGHPL